MNRVRLTLLTFLGLVAAAVLFSMRDESLPSASAQAAAVNVVQHRRPDRLLQRFRRHRPGGQPRRGGCGGAGQVTAVAIFLHNPFHAEIFWQFAFRSTRFSRPARTRPGPIS